MLDRWARMYGVTYSDYADRAGYGYGREGDGLLVASGCGLMMAVMDACPALRYCFDTDTQGKNALWADWLICAERYASMIVVAGWFSISDPAPLVRGVAGLADPSRVIVYARA